MNYRSYMSYKYYVLILFAAALLAAPFITSADGLVPCGGPNDYCTICDLYQLAHNILNFLLVKVAVPLATIAFLIGGFILLTSGGSEQKLATGKKAITGALFGLVIAFASWLIVDVTLRIVGAQITDTGTGSYLPWNEFPSCPDVKPVEVQTPPAATTTPARTTPTSATTQQLAHELWSKRLCGGTASCGGVNACTTLREVAGGQAPSICFNGCTPSDVCGQKPDVQLDPNMLQAILNIRDSGLSFVISSLTTGSHSENSKHYQGTAVDLVKTGDTTYPQLEQALNAQRARSVQCEASRRTVPCSSFTVDHIHAESFF